MTDKKKTYKYVKFYLKKRFYQLMEVISVTKKQRLKFKAKVKKYRCKLYELKSGYYNSPVSRIDNPVWESQKRDLRILLIGRQAVGDSLATHTTSFLNTFDYTGAEFYFFDEYTHNLYRVLGQNEHKFIKNCCAPELNGRDFDITIFANVLDYGNDEYSLEDQLPTNRSFLMFAYSVFDGTVPPKNWVNHINTYFDALLVPCDNLKTYFETNGCYKPVFSLPICLNLLKYRKDLSGFKMLTQSPYVFGWIGVAEDRKNIMKIINAFEKAFGDNPDVQLKIHCRHINVKTPDGIEFEKVKDNLPHNIIVSTDLLSDEQMIDLMHSFDAYVYVSKGEGYSITPRQALATGLPIILSGIPTHQQITSLKEDAGVFWVPAKIEEDAVQPSLNNQICGKMFDILEADLIKSFKKLYANREKLNQPDVIKKRQNSMNQFDETELMWNYKQIICPHYISYGSSNVLSKDKYSTNSKSLLIKYEYLNKVKKNNYIVCPAHDGGFCSLVNKYISHIAYSGMNDVIIPDWRLSTILMDKLKREGTTKLESFCYGGLHDDNIFFRYFLNPYSNDELNENMCETDIMYTICDKQLDAFDFNAENEPNLTYINSYNLYADKSYFFHFRKKYNYFLKHYLRLKPEIENEINEFYNKNLKGKFVISAQVRCAAHSLELKSEDKPSVEKYERHILEILKQNKISPKDKNWALFLATDNDDAVTFFKKKFGTHVCMQKMQRLSHAQEAEYKKTKQKLGKDVTGFELQHRAAQDPKLCTLDRGKEILFDVFTLAKGDYFIFVNSNISTMVSYVNPDIEMVYCN